MREKYELIESNRLEINLKYAEAGVEFIDIKQAYIEDGVKIGNGTIIYPCVILEGKTKIGENCVIGQNSRIVDSQIDDDVEIQNSVVIESTIGSETKVGPFAYLRPNSNVGKGCKIGDFVEIKNSNVGSGSKASHLTYIGDADIEEDVNLGCGVVFVNYDGKNKYRSKVQKGAFIGCNVNLVSPVTVEEEAYIAAGSTVTKDVLKEALYVERSEPRIIKGWVKRRKLNVNKK